MTPVMLELVGLRSRVKYPTTEPQRSIDYVVKVVRDPCQKITLLLLKSKSVRVIVPESCF